MNIKAVALQIEEIRAQMLMSSLDLLGDIVHPGDRDADWMQSKNSYIYYYAIGNHVRPKLAVEIGTRLGYSAKAISMGARDAWPTGDKVEFHSFDNESYIEGSLSICKSYFDKCKYMNFVPHAMDTGKVGALPLPDKADLFHIDGDHSFKGAFHDMILSKYSTKIGGFILIDDVGADRNVWLAAMRFCKCYGLEPAYLPTFRGMFLIENK